MLPTGKNGLEEKRTVSAGSQWVQSNASYFRIASSLNLSARGPFPVKVTRDGPWKGKENDANKNGPPGHLTSVSGTEQEADTEPEIHLPESTRESLGLVKQR